jgi:hypothetical protein
MRNFKLDMETFDQTFVGRSSKRVARTGTAACPARDMSAPKTNKELAFLRLPLEANQFDLVVGNGSLVHSERIPKTIAEMTRVAVPGATVTLSLPTFSSFGEFFSIYWEALHNCRLLDHEADVESLITTLPSVSLVEEMVEAAGLEDVASWTAIEEFDYESSEKFLGSPLISDFLMPIWLETLPRGSQEHVVKEIGRLINEERHEAEFALTVKATLVMGRKAPSQ